MTERMDKQRKYAHLFSQVSNGFKVVGIAALLILGYLQSAENHMVSERIVDCTSPTGKCFKEGQARTNTAVVQLNTVAKYAAVCADRPGSITAQEMNDCIEEQLRKNP